MASGWRLLHEARRERATCQSLPRDDALSSHTRRRLRPHPSFLSALGKREVLKGHLATDAATRAASSASWQGCQARIKRITDKLPFYPRIRIRISAVRARG